MVEQGAIATFVIEFQDTTPKYLSSGTALAGTTVLSFDVHLFYLME